MPSVCKLGGSRGYTAGACEDAGVGIGGDVARWKSMSMPKSVADRKALASMGEPGSSSSTLLIPLFSGTLVFICGRCPYRVGLGDASTMREYCESLK